MKRRALLVGINKYACGSNLNGCVNDVSSLEKKLIPLGFEIRKLLDRDATRDNWLNELCALAKWTRSAGDEAEAFHGHSHHGSQESDKSEADGLRELWCPTDWPNRISDKQVSALLDQVHEKAFLLDWADCCHASGSTRELFFKRERPKFIPGEGVEGRFIVSSTPVDVENRPNIAQFAACRSNQTSADAFINGSYCGAFTHYAMTLWGGMRTLGQLVDESATLLSRNGYSQRPEFCGTSANSLRQVW